MNQTQLEICGVLMDRIVRSLAESKALSQHSQLAHACLSLVEATDTLLALVYELHREDLATRPRPSKGLRESTPRSP